MFVFIGDVNINNLRAQACKLAQQFLDCLQSYALLPTIDKPTRVYNNSVKRIDNIFTNKFCKYFASGSIASDMTNHFFHYTFFACRFCSLNTDHVTIPKRVFSCKAGHFPARTRSF